MAYFDELMQRALTVRNNVAPSSNTAILVGGVLVSIVSALQLLLDTKQGTLTFDDEPTDGSTNPVTSNGIYDAIVEAIAAIDLSACEKIVNKVTAIDDESTDVQYPTAKLLYDSLQALANEYAAINHTHHYTDINQPAIVATAGAQGYTIATADYSHIITLTADTTLHLPTITAGTARIMRLTLIQDLTGGHGVTFDGGNAQVYNPYQVDLSQGLGGYRCWITLWYDGAQWCYIATPYVLRSESQFDYTISGTSTGTSVTITINGSTMNIPVNAGAWEYGYNGAVTSLSLAGDTGVTTIDFSLSDGLAGVTSLAGAFSGCSALQSIDFTDCDLSAIVDATNAFSGCSALTALTIPSGEWLPDLDLSATAIGYSAMADVIIGLHTYASGTHTVTFNSTIWDALTQAQQQTISDAAGAKGWTTNALMVVYAIRGKSSAASETFTVTFIEDVTLTIAAENITCAVDADGNWEYEYRGKKLYVLDNTWRNTTTITEIEITEECDKLISANQLYTNNQGGYSPVTTISFPNATFDNLVNAQGMFGTDQSKPIATIINIPQATFASLQNASAMFQGITTDIILNQTFSAVTDASYMFRGCGNVTLTNATFAAATNINSMFANCSGSISLPSATFANATSAQYMFQNSTTTSVSMPLATFASVTNAQLMFNVMPNLQTLSLPSATFASCTNGYGIFAQFNTAALRTISMPNATFGALLASGSNSNLFGGLTVSQSITALEFAQNGLNTSLQVPCNLNYTNMLNVANWLADRTGLSASTITFRTAVWNALSAAEQANIDAILSGKNWTRVLG